MNHTFPVGTSEPQDFQLTNRGAELDGDDLEVGLTIFKRVDNEMVAVTPAPTVTWLNQSAGTVRVTGTEALAVGKYYVRFTLTDGAGKVGFAPNGQKAHVWNVVEVPGT